MIIPAKVRPGERVAILSPSEGLPEVFPRPFELGLRRLREEFDLVPVEYPTTRRMGSSPADRAADLHAAFADPDITAVLTSIGGDDQVTVLPHLDSELLRANPKIFLGFSDNTTLLSHLYDLGIVGFHGGAIMTAFGRSGAMHPVTAKSLRAALFTSGDYELAPVTAFGDVEIPWDDPDFGEREPALEPGTGWIWHNADQTVEGTSWGGCLEVLSWLMMADRVRGPVERFAGGVLLLETTEELPSATEVFRILRCMGERGLLRQFSAAVIGRAKGWSLDRRTTSEERAAYLSDQREAVLRAFAAYAPRAMLVFDVDFGHTDPQVVIPHGGHVRLDGPAQRITVTY